MRESFDSIRPSSASPRAENNNVRLPPCNTHHKANVTYVIPQYSLGRGPSTAYKKIRWAVALAIHLNMGTVAMPIEGHKTQHKSSPIRFEDTFDLDRLRQLIPVISPEEIACVCDTSLQNDAIRMVDYNKNSPHLRFEVVELYPSLKYLDSHLPAFNNLLNVTMSQKNVHIRDVDFKTIYASRPCINIIPYEMNFKDKNEVHKLVDQYLVRVKYIRDIAKLIVNNICGGNFAVMHWRNKTGERCALFDMCSTTHFAHLPGLADSVVPLIVTGVINIMKANKQTCLYIAKPNYEQAIVQVFRNSSLMVYTLEDIIETIPDLRKYIHDDYVISLIEQEIAERVPLFISSRSSNWSFYVEYTRHIRHMKTIGLDEIPGLPKNITEKYNQII
uniref:peptide-O-fucosyltransferase n=1 Tax=Saccoglossus kowalevskii TaxID=10224 RepID=A0ABM0M923_SACKO|nr:PREDICTED: uncharacterized protein LOC102807931 [Saccoglossus kowalevskii]